MSVCSACGASVPNKKNRCSLSSNLLLTMLSEVSRVESGEIRRGIDSSGFVCKKCKLKLQRLHKLKKQASELQQTIISSLPSSGPAHSRGVGSETGNSPSTVCPATPAASNIQLQSPRSRRRSSEQRMHKRRRLSLREFESRCTGQSSSTPDIAVSSITTNGCT